MTIVYTPLWLVLAARAWECLSSSERIKEEKRKAESEAASAKIRANESERAACMATANAKAAEAEATSAKQRCDESQSLSKALCQLPDLNPHVRKRIRERIPSLSRCSNAAIKKKLAIAWQDRAPVNGQSGGKQMVLLQINDELYTFVVADGRFRTVLTLNQVKTTHERKRYRSGVNRRQRNCSKNNRDRAAMGEDDSPV